MSSNHFFRVSNHHSADCGAPPLFDDQIDLDITYRSYFENEHGEQWVLLYDNSQDMLRLFGGDCGWGTPLRVYSLRQTAEGMAKRFHQPTLLEEDVVRERGDIPVIMGPDGVVNLSESEQRWLHACLSVIGRRRKSLAGVTPEIARDLSSE